ERHDDPRGRGAARLRRAGRGHPGAARHGARRHVDDPPCRLMAARIEEDLLGKREIPGDVYWGIHTLRAVENFALSGTRIADLPDLVRGMVLVKKASALANRDLRTLPADVAGAIIGACDDMLEHGRCLDQRSEEHTSELQSRENLV